MMANYEIVEFIAVMHVWFTNFHFSSKGIQIILANMELKENLGYIFVSYF